MHPCSVVASFAGVRGRIRAIVSTRSLPPTNDAHVVRSASKLRSSWDPLPRRGRRTMRHVSRDDWFPGEPFHFERLKRRRGRGPGDGNAPLFGALRGILSAGSFVLVHFKRPNAPLSSYPRPGPSATSRPFDERSTVLSLRSVCATNKSVSRWRWRLQGEHVIGRDAWKVWNACAENRRCNTRVRVRLGRTEAANPDPAQPSDRSNPDAMEG